MTIQDSELLARLDRRVGILSICRIATFAELMEQAGFAEIPQWLNCFDTDELLAFTTEILTGVESQRWDDLQATIHEWHESAIAITSPGLRESWNDSSDEVLLTKPC